MSGLLHSLLEKVAINRWTTGEVDGVPCYAHAAVMKIFRGAPYDMLPEFEGPAGSRLRGGRGKDHPRYGRFIYALARHYQPKIVLEIGSYAGGTGIGWARAMVENGAGTLICVDNDTYSKNTYPGVTRTNLRKAGLPEKQVEFHNGNSKKVIPDLAARLRGQVDICLVDGDHTFEGALQDIENCLPLVRPGGLLLVHDVDRARRMDEQTEQHPHPVYEAVKQVVQRHQLSWCVLRFIRKHLAVVKIP
jgi:predicted O-methyltransferase YrrM